MVTLKDLYTGGVAPGISQGMQWAGQKQSIDNAKTRNQLADLALQNEPQRIQDKNRLAALGIQGKEQAISQNQQAQGVTNLDLLRRALEGFGPISEIQDDDLANQRFQMARGVLQNVGVDLAGMPETVTAQELQAVSGMTGGTRGSGFQFGAQETFKDSEGNLFFGTTKRNAQTGQMDAILSPVGGGPAQPVGGVQMVGSYGQTINEKITNSITEASGKAGAEEGAKLEQQLRFKPQIQGAVKEAEQQAKERGEALTDLKRAEAAMPGLMETMEELRQLAPIVSSTFGEKLFDEAVKQSGFGATEGATTRAKYTAIIDNQVLPLLRDTFGAAFTEAEGERLRATMGDPDASPEQKTAQLDAFIKQKYRDLQTKRATVEQMGGENGTAETSIDDETEALLNELGI